MAKFTEDEMKIINLFSEYKDDLFRQFKYQIEGPKLQELKNCLSYIKSNYSYIEAMMDFLYGKNQYRVDLCLNKNIVPIFSYSYDIPKYYIKYFFNSINYISKQLMTMFENHIKDITDLKIDEFVYSKDETYLKADYDFIITYTSKIY